MTKCLCRYCTPRTGRYQKRTNIEDILLHIVLAEFPKVISEKNVGKYRVDAYLPAPYHLAFEADGEYWHTRPGAIYRDQKRDSYLWRRFKLPVIRFTGNELLEIEKMHIEEVKKRNDTE